MVEAKVVVMLIVAVVVTKRCAPVMGADNIQAVVFTFEEGVRHCSDVMFVRLQVHQAKGALQLKTSPERRSRSPSSPTV